MSRFETTRDEAAGAGAQQQQSVSLHARTKIMDDFFFFSFLFFQKVLIFCRPGEYHNRENKKNIRVTVCQEKRMKNISNENKI